MSRAERILVVALCAAVGAFYFWTVRSSGDPWRPKRDRRDYYNCLIDGWLDGHLHMKVEVPAALLALPNPYDPAQRPPGVGLHDASLYRGKYYVYFGVAPAVTLMLPWRLATGTDMPLAAAVLAFVFGGFVASVALFCAVRRRYFPESGALVLALGVLTLGLAGAWLALVRRPHMWELPIAGGYAFAMLALLGVWRSLHAEATRSRVRWLAAAALALGLAIASRPTYLFTMPLFAAPLAWWWRKERRVPAREAVAAALPLAFIGAALAWHNWARFGSPLEFGQAYQLSLDYESKLPHFSPRYAPLTAWAHFFCPAEWQAWFPFIRARDLGAGPAGFTPHRGDVYGVLVSYPIAWLALLAPLALWRRSEAERGPLGAWLAAAAWLFAGGAAVMLLFFSALSRYQVDFMPAFMVLAGVGLLALERRLAPRAWVSATVTLAAAYGVMFGVLFSLGFDGLLRERNPALAQEIARALNRLPAALERAAGVGHGPLELTVRWPAMKAVGDETLLAIGRAPLVDRLIARHLGDGRVQLGFAPAGGVERFAPPRALAPDTPHRIRVALASLFPPPDHPFFAGRTPAEVRAMLRRAEIAVDGETVLLEHLRLDRPGSGEVRVARMDAWRRVAPTAEDPPTSLPGNSDTLRLRVRLRPQPPGTREPLVVTGRSGAGELILLEHLGHDEVRFVLDSWGSPPRASAALRIDFAAEHELRITHGSLATVDDAAAARPGGAAPVRVVVDGKLVWEDRAEFHPAEHGEVHVGRNPIGGTSCGPVFSGEILAAERVARE